MGMMGFAIKMATVVFFSMNAMPPCLPEDFENATGKWYRTRCWGWNLPGLVPRKMGVNVHLSILACDFILEVPYKKLVISTG